MFLSFCLKFAALKWKMRLTRKCSKEKDTFAFRIFIEQFALGKISFDTPFPIHLVCFCNFGSGSNVYQLLARREVAPRAKHSLKRLWGEGSKWHHNSIGPRCEAARNSRLGLISW